MIETKSMQEYQKEYAAQQLRYNMSLSTRILMDDKILGKNLEKPVKKRKAKRRPRIDESLYNVVMSKAKVKSNGKKQNFNESLDGMLKINIDNFREKLVFRHHNEWLETSVRFHKALHWISGIVITLLLCAVGMLY